MQDTRFNSNNLNKELLETLLQNNKDFTTSRILEQVINMLMKAERDVHLKENINDKGNGYYERKLGTPVGVLGLDVPRDLRKGTSVHKSSPIALSGTPRTDSIPYKHSFYHHTHLML
jgi:hypothetical protein